METEKPMKDPDVKDEVDEEHPLLDLSESLTRPIVRGPDGKPYELRTPEEFSVEDEHLLRAELERFSQLQELGKLTPKQSAELQLRMNNAFEKLFIGDSAAKALFNDRKRQRVLLFFRTQWAVEDLAAINEAKDQIEKTREAADDSTTAS